jgi:SAM-dependent methyltransferase/predicted transcriptional regulator
MDREALVTRLSDSTLAFLELLTLYIGDRLGLYAALAEAGPATSTELAARTGTHERYVREWLEQQAASGLLEVDDPDAEPQARRFRIPAGNAEVLVDRESLHYQAARPKSLLAVARRLPAVLEAFRTGGGVQGDDAEAREAQAELGRVRFLRLLGSAWLPAVPDVHARLLAEPGARVADLGCGGGWSAIALARAYPQTRVDGFDLDAPAIALAQRNAVEAGVEGRVRFFVRDAADPSLEGSYDLALAFETLHDMPRPVEALASMRRLVGERGAVIVADEKVNESFQAPADTNTRLGYGWSVLSCLSSAMAGENPAGTGAVMRPSVLGRYARAAGFREVEVLPIEDDLWRFYRLRG